MYKEQDGKAKGKSFSNNYTDCELQLLICADLCLKVDSPLLLFTSQNLHPLHPPVACYAAALFK